MKEGGQVVQNLTAYLYEIDEPKQKAAGPARKKPWKGFPFHGFLVLGSKSFVSERFRIPKGLQMSPNRGLRAQPAKNRGKVSPSTVFLFLAANLLFQNVSAYPRGCRGA